MRRFYLFRSNLKTLEYYHDYKDLQTFEQKCHDYYLLFPIWMLRNNMFDEVVIWRLSDTKLPEIIFDVDGKKFIQRWCKNFNQVFEYDPCTISFWRGGFKEYDEVTKINPNHFGLKLYLSAGKRCTPQFGGVYDAILMEDDTDLKVYKGTYPFYKTAAPNIFKPLEGFFNNYWDICWPCNFSQLSYKGQEFFINLISKNPELQKLKIIHIGNKPEIGKNLCEKYNVKNIEFSGHHDREKLNRLFQHCSFGLNLSNRLDGCPRVSTEILMSGLPLIIHERTRLLSYYKRDGVIEVNDKNIVSKLIDNIHIDYKKDVKKAINSYLSFDEINKKNIAVWEKL